MKKYVMQDESFSVLTLTCNEINIKGNLKYRMHLNNSIVKIHLKHRRQISLLMSIEITRIIRMWLEGD